MKNENSNDIIQIFVDGKEVGTIDYVLKPPAEFSSDNKEFGSKISRTMKKLATSTPEHRNKVKIFFYGQSITDQVWWWETVRVLKARFPYADIEVMNPSIGGYTVPKLLRTGEHDIYPYYPDLIIFHAYESKGGNIEQMVKNIRSRTSAEIILWTHHANTKRSANKPDNMEIRKTAKDYGSELVEVEEEWMDYMLNNNLRRTDLLRDGVHLSPYGCRLLAQLISRHFQYIPGAENRWSKSISKLIPKPDENGSIKIDFTGNRVDLISGAAPEGTKLGSAKILIDGKKPSAFPELYQFSRSSIGLCVVRPAIHKISHKRPLIVEDWRIEITDVKFSKKEGKDDILIEFEIIGSKTGKDGKGNNQKLFVSNSGRVVIEPQDWNLMPYSPASVKAQKLKDIDISWRVMPFFKDTFQSKEIKDSASEEITIIAQGLKNSKHTLEIIPNGDGLVLIKEILIHKPQGTVKIL